MENISTWNYYEPDFLPASSSAACVLSVLCVDTMSCIHSFNEGQEKFIWLIFPLRAVAAVCW